MPASQDSVLETLSRNSLIAHHVDHSIVTQPRRDHLHSHMSSSDTPALLLDSSVLSVLIVGVLEDFDDALLDVAPGGELGVAKVQHLTALDFDLGVVLELVVFAVGRGCGACLCPLGYGLLLCWRGSKLRRWSRGRGKSRGRSSRRCWCFLHGRGCRRLGRGRLLEHRLRGGGLEHRLRGRGLEHRLRGGRHGWHGLHGRCLLQFNLRLSGVFVRKCNNQHARANQNSPENCSAELRKPPFLSEPIRPNSSILRHDRQIGRAHV